MSPHDDQFVYHVTLQKNLLEINDIYFRAKIWGGKDPVTQRFPHKELMKAAIGIGENSNIFNISFWENLHRARDCQGYLSPLRDANYITRCLRNHLFHAGFNEAPDPEVGTGGALHFWIAEEHSEKFSRSGISLSSFSILTNDNWQPLDRFIKEQQSS